MELHDVHTNSTSNHSTGIGHPVASIILYAMSWLFMYFETLTADQIWTWVWRGLSLISLLLIIFINWHKVVEIRNKKKQSGEG